MTNTLLLIFSVLLIPNLTKAETLNETLFREAKANHSSCYYADARKKMFNELDLEKDSTGYYIAGVYCHSQHYPFAGQHPNGRLPDHNQFNTEHTWPQSKFSRRFRKDVQKTDLHHLFPTFSRINSERGNLPYAEVEPSKELSCPDSHIGRPAQGG